MALEGNLKDFSLSDMFRLLATGSKTGALHVERDEISAVVCFKTGQVFAAYVGQAPEPVSKALGRSGVVSEKQLRQAQGLMKIQKKDKAERKLGQILVDEGYIEQAILEGFVKEQVSDVLFDLLRWEDGELRFESDQPCSESDLGISISVDAVLADAGKRLDSWNKIREKIPSMDTRFAMAPGPSQKSAEIHLKPREWMLLCFLHGGKSVTELVALTGFNDFETARILYAMYAGGLIEKVGPAGEPLPE